MSLARDGLLAAIRGYKRHVSPRKGFACAYRVHLGACSCSTLGLRAISRYGAWRGLGVLRLRLAQCRLAAEEARARPVVAQIAQAGFIDCDVPCDADCLDSAACSCFDLSGVDCAACDDCDWWPWRDRRTEAIVRRRWRRGDPVTREAGPGASPPA